MIKAKLKKLNQREKLSNEIFNAINELCVKPIPTKKIGANLFIVQYIDIKDSWLPKDILLGESENIKALASKVKHMLNVHYDPDSVMRMLTSIMSNTVKSLKQPTTGFYDMYLDKRMNKSEHLGYGHFRWNYQAYTLTDEEIEELKKIFN